MHKSISHCSFLAQNITVSSVFMYLQYKLDCLVKVDLLVHIILGIGSCSLWQRSVCWWPLIQGWGFLVLRNIYVIYVLNSYIVIYVLYSSVPMMNRINTSLPIIFGTFNIYKYYGYMNIYTVEPRYKEVPEIQRSISL